MRVKAKMNIVLDGKKYSIGEVFDVNGEQRKRLGSLVEDLDTVEQTTIEEKAIKPAVNLEKKAVKKGRKGKSK